MKHTGTWHWRYFSSNQNRDIGIHICSILFCSGQWNIKLLEIDLGSIQATEIDVNFWKRLQVPKFNHKQQLRIVHVHQSWKTCILLKSPPIRLVHFMPIVQVSKWKFQNGNVVIYGLSLRAAAAWICCQDLHVHVSVLFGMLYSSYSDNSLHSSLQIQAKSSVNWMKEREGNYINNVCRLPQGFIYLYNIILHDVESPKTSRRNKRIMSSGQTRSLVTVNFQERSFEKFFLIASL